MVSRRAMLAASAAAFACGRKKHPGFNGYAFVANEEGRAVAAVDLSTFSVARHIRLDDAPTAVIAHPSRAVVYAMTPKSGAVYEIDASTLTVARRLQVGGAASGMRLSADGSVLWVLGGARPQLSAIALDSFTAAARIPLPGPPGDLDVAPRLDLAVVTLAGEGAISLIDLAARKAGPPRRIGQQLGAVRFLSNGESLVAANTAERLLTAVQSSDGRIITHLPLAVRPDHLCFNRDGGQLFITGEGGDSVVVVYPYFVPQVAETVLAGSTPGAMAAGPQFLFIANTAAGDVSILNIARRRVVAVAGVGSEPAYIAITPDDRYALVLNRRSGDMAVIRTAAIVPDRRKSAALFTMIPVGSKPVSAAVKAV